MSDERAAVLIDNYYLKKEVLDKKNNGFKLDYKAFSDLLCKKANANHFRTYVYDCEFKSNELLLKILESLPNFEIQKGTKQKLGQHYVQKQVDIMLAVQMIQLNKINVQNIIVVSGDADFIPAVKYVKESGSRVYVWSAPKDYKGELARSSDVPNPIDDSVLIPWTRSINSKTFDKRY
jgi:uncharacterized LabA/DUF88 family protein